MLNENGFNEWASAYDESVRESAQEESYPFAGYGKVLETIFQAASAGPGKKLLDVGFGTAALTHRFYSAGAEISGMDFSETIGFTKTSCGSRIIQAPPQEKRALLWSGPICHGAKRGRY